MRFSWCFFSTQPVVPVEGDPHRVRDKEELLGKDGSAEKKQAVWMAHNRAYQSPSQKTMKRIGSKGTRSRSLAQRTESGCLRRRGKEGTAATLEPKQSGCLCAQLERNWPSYPASWLRWDGRREKPSMKCLAEPKDGGHRLFAFQETKKTSGIGTYASASTYLFIGAFLAQDRSPRRSASAAAYTRQLLVPALPSRLVVFGLVRRRGASINLR